MPSMCPRKSQKSNIIVMENDGQVLVYDVKTNKAFALNETSAMIWNLCDGKQSLSEISLSVGEKLNANVDDGLVWLALDQLQQEGLLENEVVMPDSLSGLSRRQAIRRISLAAAITLPLISSLVAPTSITAASITPAIPAPPVPI